MYPNRRRRQPAPSRRLKTFLKAWLPWPRLRLRMLETGLHSEGTSGAPYPGGLARLPDRRSRYNRRDSRGPWSRTRVRSSAPIAR